MERGDALAEATQNHHQPGRREAHPLERRVCEEVEDPTAGAASIVHYRLAVPIARRLLSWQIVAFGAVQALGMERLEQQPIDRHLVEQVVDGEQHRAPTRNYPETPEKGPFTSEGT